jgi:hypothetical protein
MNASLGDTAFAALRAVLGTQHLQSWGHSICSLGDTAFVQSRGHSLSTRGHISACGILGDTAFERCRGHSL